MTRDEAVKISRALRGQRPYMLDENPNNMVLESDRKAYYWSRDAYVNIATALADVVYEATGGSFEREIFLSNARVVKLAPFICTKCGQHITDGKPCGHGRRDELGIE